jgi:SAM-dependent methyltransferase
MWDKRYSELGFAYGKDANDFLKNENHRIPPGGKVLCLAEGEGRNAVYLAKLGYQVTAIDLSEVDLNKARVLAKENDVEIKTIVADLADFDFGINEWDGIVSISAHMPEPIRKRAHAQVAPSLRENGVFILEAYTYEHTQMEGIGGPPAAQEEMFMSLKDLRQRLNVEKSAVQLKNFFEASSELKI